MSRTVRLGTSVVIAPLHSPAVLAKRVSTIDNLSAGFDRIYSSPQPTRGTVPIVLGGNSARALERAGRIGDGWYPYTIGPDEFETSIERLRDVAAAAGRDPDTIEVTVWPGSHDPTSEFDVDYVRRFVAADRQGPPALDHPVCRARPRA